MFTYGCGGGDSDTASPIVGSWSFFVPPANSCEESHTFNSNGSWSQSGANERRSGTYTFDETTNAGERDTLIVTITADNSQADCISLTTDETGDIVTYYVTFRNSNATMDLYDNPTGGAPRITMTKK